MKTEILNKIKRMREDSNRILEFNERYRRTIAAPSCDKYGYGFGEDSRFTAFEVKTNFSSHAGYYGNSGCSKVLNLQDDELVQTYFIRALNVHQGLLFETTARLLREDAAKFTVEAEKEIADLVAMLEAAKGDAS